MAGIQLLKMNGKSPVERTECSLM